MNVLKVINKKTFFNDSFFNFDDGTYAKGDIILLNRETNIIYKIDKNFKSTLYKPPIKINKICYDECENCYWALLDSNYKIYKLNEHFRKISCISLKYPVDSPFEICDMSYCENDNLFVITTKKYIFKFDKNGSCKEKIYEKNSLKTYYSSYCFCNSTYVLYSQNKETYISILMNGKETDCYKIPSTCTPFSILHIKKEKNSKSETITLIATENNSNKKYLISLSDNDDNSSIPCISDELDNEEMIHSILSIEKSLAYILDLESEKLRKGISLANTVDEMLKLNENLTETIINITQLEYLLMNRLKSLNGFK